MGEYTVEVVNSDSPDNKQSIMYVKAPSHTERYVVWDTERGGGLLVYLIGYCPDTLAYFIGLFLDARKVVPDVDPNKAICTKVAKSRCCKGFTLVTIEIKGPKRELTGFAETSWDRLMIDSH